MKRKRRRSRLGRLLRGLVVAALCASLAILLARAAFPLPGKVERTASTALAPATTGPLAAVVAERAQRHPGRSGIAALDNGLDAFAARALLADAAVQSIDVQYYIWRGDLTGTLLLDALQRAAERGVRVRLLLDDLGSTGLDAELAALDAHPNAEVRLYNPFNLRRLKFAAFAFDFFRLNRRMHNKSFTVDGLATVLGGRNIADEYFGAGPMPLFLDLDVLAVGAVVPAVSADFDRYWAAPSVYPASAILPRAGIGDPIDADVRRLQADPRLATYAKALAGAPLLPALARGDLALEWTRARLVSDDPAKGEGAVPRDDLLLVRLMRAVGPIRQRIDGVSPYFVPGAAGVKAFAALEDEGIAVRVLTNSLAATDGLPVHAGYARRRPDLLRHGVRLFELRPQAALAAPRERGPLGGSGSSLHAKTFAVDGTRVFVGSFNFDPRSTRINTEMGLLIDSEALAQRLHGAFDSGLGAFAWEVVLRDGQLTWVDHANGTQTTSEPGATWPRRLLIRFIGCLPVEWLL